MTVTDPYQVEAGALLLGRGQPWEITGISGLDVPPLRVDDQTRPGRDGADDSGPDLYGPRVPVVSVKTSSEVQADIEAAVVALKQAWRRSTERQILRVHVEGGVRRIYGRPRGVQFVYDSDRVVRARCEWFAGDPNIYSDTLRAVSLPEPDDTGGATWPLSWPAAWGASDTGIVDLDNHDIPDFATLAGMSLVVAGEAAATATDRSLHVHGGYGFAEEYDIQLFYRRARAWSLVLDDPARECRRIADLLLGAA